VSAGLDVADVFRRHGELFCQTHAGHIGRVERRVMGAITACRTAALGGHVEQCDDCGATRIAYNSCRNRHCPKCQGAARERWLAERRGEVLPIPYFHVVFTLPPAAAEIAFQNKAAVYAILFRSAAAALMKLAANRAISKPNSASSPSSIPGGRHSSIIPTSIASYLAADPRSMDSAGCPASLGSSCPSVPWHVSSAACSSPNWAPPSRPEI